MYSLPFPGGGHAKVVGKLSEGEWSRWKTQNPGLTMFALWSQTPLYPDPNPGSTMSSSQTKQYTIEDLPIYHYNDGFEKASSSKKRTTDSKKSVSGTASYTTQVTQMTNLETPCPTEKPVLEQSGNSKKRTADDSDVESDDSPTAKRPKRSIRAAAPSPSMLFDASRSTIRGNGQSEGHGHAPQTSLPPLPKVFRGHPRPNLTVSQVPNDRIRDHNSQSKAQASSSPKEEEDTEILDLDPIDEGNPSNTSITIDRSPPKLQVTQDGQTHTKPGPGQKQEQQIVRVVIPRAPTKISPAQKPPKERKARRKSAKKRRAVDEGIQRQTRYTSKHLRPGVGKRGHKSTGESVFICSESCR